MNFYFLPITSIAAKGYSTETGCRSASQCAREGLVAAGMLEALLLLWSCLLPQEVAPLAGTFGTWSSLAQSLSEKVGHPMR